MYPLRLYEYKRGNSKTSFLISQQKHAVGTQKNHLRDRTFERPKQMFKLMDKKRFTILRSTILFYGAHKTQVETNGQEINHKFRPGF